MTIDGSPTIANVDLAMTTLLAAMTSAIAMVGRDAAAMTAARMVAAQIAVANVEVTVDRDLAQAHAPATVAPTAAPAMTVVVATEAADAMQAKVAANTLGSV
jgi:ribulose-5-phosphate 4-epimerase/fuculose-1-phosphate aldolase